MHVSHFKCDTFLRMATMQTQIDELREECDRASRALESQKEVAAKTEAGASKKIDELGRDIQTKVIQAIPQSLLLAQILPEYRNQPIERTVETVQ
jgi:hypothetical protein